MTDDKGAPTPSDIDAKRRFRDVTHIRLKGKRLLTDAEEAALLELALDDLGLSLATARGVLLHQAVEMGVMLESREERRVIEVIEARAKGRRLDRRGVAEAAIMAAPLCRAAGRPGDATRRVADLADSVGVTPHAGFKGPGPYGWWTALSQWRDRTAPVWTVIK